MTLSATELRQRVQKLNLTCARLQGVLATNTARKNELVRDVAAAKARQGLGEEIKRIFDSLQMRAHERSVGSYERVLSALLNDVLPDEGKVRFIPTYRNNTTWLDINLENDGHLEDIFDGNGGAVNNVVSTGLRFTALMRTKNRKFMVLDEPDCWIKEPEKNVALIRVIAQVAEQTGIQTVFISHFTDPSVFTGLVNVVRLARDKEGNPQAQVVQPVVHQWPDNATPGIRQIELVNVCRHVHTVLPCFPGPTVLIGPHNLGKSTIMTRAMKAMAYGEFDEGMIRHGCDEAKIIVRLENDVRIECIRSRKRSPAVVYKLYEGNGDKPTHEGRPKTRNSVPEWVEKALGITRVDDFDIQLTNQKLPVFLLNETASRRAQILSLGRESGHLKTLMKRYEEVRDADNETVKRGEAELMRLNYNLERLEGVPALTTKLAVLTQKSEELCTRLTQHQQIASLLTRIEDSTARIAASTREVAVLSKLPEAPTLVDVEKPRRLAEIIDRSQALLAVLKLPAMPESPALVDTARILDLGVRISKSEQRIAALKHLPVALPAQPELKSLDEVSRVITGITSAQARVKTADDELVAATKAEAEGKAGLERVRAELGVCPLCDSHLNTEQDHVAHAH